MMTFEDALWWCGALCFAVAGGMEVGLMLAMILSGLALLVIP